MTLTEQGFTVKKRMIYCQANAQGKRFLNNKYVRKEEEKKKKESLLYRRFNSFSRTMCK